MGTNEFVCLGFTCYFVLIIVTMYMLPSPLSIHFHSHFVRQFSFNPGNVLPFVMTNHTYICTMQFDSTVSSFALHFVLPFVHWPRMPSSNIQLYSSACLLPGKTRTFFFSIWMYFWMSISSLFQVVFHFPIVIVCTMHTYTHTHTMYHVTSLPYTFSFEWCMTVGLNVLERYVDRLN